MNLCVSIESNHQSSEGRKKGFGFQCVHSDDPGLIFRHLIPWLILKARPFVPFFTDANSKRSTSFRALSAYSGAGRSFILCEGFKMLDLSEEKLMSKVIDFAQRIDGVAICASRKATWHSRQYNKLLKTSVAITDSALCPAKWPIQISAPAQETTHGLPTSKFVRDRSDVASQRKENPNKTLKTQGKDAETQKKMQKRIQNAKKNANKRRENDGVTSVLLLLTSVFTHAR